MDYVRGYINTQKYRHRPRPSYLPRHPRPARREQPFLVEAVTNIETVKALAVEPQFDHKWEDLLARYVRTTFENVKFRLVIGGFSGVMQTVTSLLILWYGGHLVMDGYFTLGQLIAIARALIMDPRVLIFDEATSALDYESEHSIMANIGQIAKGRTMLMIAHRLSTVEHCDAIVVVDHGRIVEAGTHAELLAHRGAYYALYTAQAS